MENKKIFFGGLNELRAFAALLVVFHHIELFKKRDDIASLFGNGYTNHFIDKIGKNAVYLFFVLSGFLITFLLLQEKNKHGKVLLKKFYLRRIFRIWPLYYTIVIISFLLIPLLAYNFEIFSLTPSYYQRVTDESNYTLTALALFLLFLPNLAVRLGIAVVGATQSWSVGVEEQFYILWPFIILLFSRKHILFIFITLLVSFVSLHIVKIPILSDIVMVMPFEYMAIGGIGGYALYHYQDRICRITDFKYAYLIALLAIAILLFIPLLPVYPQSILLSFFFLLLILCSINEHKNFVFRNRAFSFLGTISYGIYMYHPFIMFLVFPFAIKFFNPAYGLWIYNIIVYLFIFGLTILISHLSYKYFESFFIKIKDTKYKSL